MNRNEIVKAALVKTGKVDPAETLSAQEIADGVAALDNLLSVWSGLGVAVWKRTAVSNALTAAKASYTIGQSGTPDISRVRPLALSSVLLRVTSTGADTPLLRASESDWQRQLEIKTAPGTRGRLDLQLTLPV